MEVNNWYFAINEHGLSEYEYHVKLAVCSFKRYHPLWKISCLYDGDLNHTVAKWLSTNGVALHGVRSRWAEQMSVVGKNLKNNFNLSVATGAYLRLEIPDIATEQHVLYTDIDVYFRARIDFSQFKLTHPFACAAEFAIIDGKPVRYKGAFNSGVMLMDVNKMKNELDFFSKFVLENSFDFNAYDQGALNDFFISRWDTLSPEFNSRVFAENFNDATIVHFHGPKLKDIIVGSQLGSEKIKHPPYRDLFKIEPIRYKKLLLELEREYPEIMEQAYSKIKS